MAVEGARFGTRVSYSDAANPGRTGTVVEVIERGGETPSGIPLPTGTEYRVMWDTEDQWPVEEGGEAVLGTVSDLRQAGWRELPVDAFGAAAIFFHALQRDELAQAYGTEDLRLWTAARATEGGWGKAPSVVWEGGPFEWAIAAPGGDSIDSDYRGGLGQGLKDALEIVRAAGFYFEAETSFMVGVYSL